MIEDNPGYCFQCNGSGEGLHDGSTCSMCKGCGEMNEQTEADDVIQHWERYDYDY